MNTWMWMIAFAAPDVLLSALAVGLAVAAIGTNLRWPAWLLAGAIVAIVSVVVRVSFEFWWTTIAQSSFVPPSVPFYRSVQLGCVASRTVGYGFWLFALAEIAWSRSLPEEVDAKGIPPVRNVAPAVPRIDWLLAGAILGTLLFPPISLVVWFVASNRLATQRDAKGPLSAGERMRLTAIYWISAIGALATTAAFVFAMGFAARHWGWVK